MRRWSWTVLFVALLAAPAMPALAQSPAGGGGAVKFRLGGFMPTGHSEFWDVTREVFTLSTGDLNGPMLGASYVASLSNHVEMGFNLDWYEATARSAQRGYVDDFGNPILHDTTLWLVPLTVDVRFLPGGRYATRGSKGQYKVRKPVPYIGVGGGANFWQYEEVGDFVDTTTDIIFFDRLEDSGTAFEVHALGGIEFPVSPAWNLFGEARYSWSEATPGGAFTSLQQGKLDLSGWSLFFGGSWQF